MTTKHHVDHNACLSAEHCALVLWEAHQFVINVLRMEELKVVKYYNRDEEAIIVCNSVIFD
jgi:hypothetical protein